MRIFRFTDVAFARNRIIISVLFILGMDLVFVLILIQRRSYFEIICDLLKRLEIDINTDLWENQPEIRNFGV